MIYAIFEMKTLLGLSCYQHRAYICFDLKYTGYLQSL